MGIDAVVAGLGNPGPRYARTRHNAGFMLVERFARAWGIGLARERFGARIGDGLVAGRRCLLVLPQTFMNLGGEPVRDVLAYASCGPERLVVVHDDLDLPPGRLRLRRGGGGSGGHRGVRSVASCLGTSDFARLRVGIGRPPERVPAEAFVLQEFPPAEREPLEAALARGCEALEVLVRDGIEAAMNRFNAGPGPEPPAPSGHPGPSPAD